MISVDTLAAAVPDPVRQVCRRLKEAGHEAYTVGGAVRDALLGRTASEWDVTTSAPPTEVQSLFQHTIPTGLSHGTVTVVVGKGSGRAQIEVTTFRGEGAYSDARHPDSVVFGVPLDEDLARRDFVMNAIALDPIDARLVDPFGGSADIAARRIRAVGDPVARFGEDGLRVMRAVRFVAALEFSLDPATEAAIPGALPSLAKVSKERIRVELLKLLGARSPRAALEIAERTGVLGVILPELSGWDRPRVLARVEAAEPDACLRLGALLWGTAQPDEVDGAMRRLTLSNADRERVVRLVRLGGEPTDDSEPAIRRALARATRAGGRDVAALWAADGRAAIAGRARAILDRGDAIAIGELALSGGDVMKMLGIPPGRRVGEILAALLERVLEDPGLNNAEDLGHLIASM